MDPLAVALEVDLSSRCGRAVEIDSFVLDDVSVLRLQQEVWEGLWRVAGEGLRQLTQPQQEVIITWEETQKHEASASEWEMQHSILLFDGFHNFS